MLIAIMDNSFQRVLANKEQSAMKEKIRIISDFRLVLDTLNMKHISKYQYIFEVRPHVASNDTGIVDAIKRSIVTCQDKILLKQEYWTGFQNEKIDSLSKEVKSMQEDIQTIKVSIKGSTQQTHSMIKELMDRTNKESINDTEVATKVSFQKSVEVSPLASENKQIKQIKTSNSSNALNIPNDYNYKNE